MAEQLDQVEPIDEESAPKRPRIGSLLTLKWKTPISGLSSFTDENSDVSFVDETIPALKIRAHKMFLSTSSVVFFKMFQGDWKDKKQEELPVPGGMSWEVFDAVISFCYGKTMEIDENMLPEVFQAADYLNLSNLKSTIAEELSQEKFDISDPLIILKLCAAARDSDSNSLPSNDVYQTAKAYIEKHIDVILEKNTDLSPLPVVAVKDIVNSEDVPVPEIQLLNFLCKWTTTKKHELPYSIIEDLFGCIRYGTFPHSQLINEVSRSTHNCEKFGAMIYYEGDIWSDIQQFCHRKRQKHRLLFYSHKKTWETRGNATLGVCTVYTGHDYAKFSIEWSPKGHTSVNPKIRLTIRNSQEQRQRESINIPGSNSTVFPPYQMKITKCEIRLAPRYITVHWFPGSPTLDGKNFQHTTPYITSVDYQYPWVILVNTRDLTEATVQALD